MEQAPDKKTRLYAIGDIHGRLDLLDRMIEAIQHDAREHGGDSLTVTLGDYVDRGPKSREVIDRLIANPFPGRHVALKGNHEALMLSFLDDPQRGAALAPPRRHGDAALVRHPRTRYGKGLPRSCAQR